MITLSTQREQLALLDALNSDEGFSVKPILLMQGKKDGELVYEDISVDRQGQPRIQSGNYGQSATTIACDFILSGRLPRRLDNASTLFSVSIDGIQVPGLSGRYTELSDSQGATSQSNSTGVTGATEVKSYSSGTLLSRVNFGEFTDYRSVTPDYLLRDLLSRAADRGGYDKNLIDVTPLSTPLLTLADSSGFKPTNLLSDGVSQLAKVGYDIRDTVFNGCSATIPLPFGNISDVSLTISAGDIMNWVRPVRKMDLYSKVAVYKENSQGDGYVFWEEADVEYSGMDNPPTAHQILPLQLNDESDNAASNAQALAYQQADLLSRGWYTWSMTLPRFNPLVERLDSGIVTERSVDDDGTWIRTWLFSIASFAHTKQQVSTQGSQLSRSSQPNGWSTATGCEGTILDEELLKVPAFIGPDLGVSTGVLETPKPAWYVEGGYLVFDESLEWLSVSDDGKYLVFSDEAPVSVASDDRYLEIPLP